MLHIPSDFTALSKLQQSPQEAFVNVIGIAVSWDNPAIVRGGRTVQNVFLQDPGYIINSDRDMRVNFLVDSADLLPRLKDRGDIILLRYVSVRSFMGRLFLSTDRYKTSFLVFPQDTVPSLDFLDTYMGGRQRLTCHGNVAAKEALRSVETRYIMELRAAAIDWLNGGHVGSRSNASRGLPAAVPKTPAAMRETVATNVSTTAPKAPGAMRETSTMSIERHALPDRPAVAPVDFEVGKLERSKTRGKFRLVKDIAFPDGRDAVYSDVCVEVLKKYNTGYRYELLVTDYTTNDMLYDRMPPEMTQNTGWGSRDDGFVPYGKQAMKVIASPPHKDFVQSHVLLNDILLLTDVKFKLDNHNHLAGDMWPDTKFPNKLNVQRILNESLPEVAALRKRKAIYQQSRLDIKKSATYPEKTLGPNQQTKANELPLKDKSERRREKKQKRRERVEAQARAELEMLSNDNRNVQCSHGDVEASSVRDVLDINDRCHTNTLPNGTSYRLPFVNANFKIKMQVIDYYPDELEDFASRVQRSRQSSDGETTDWEWSFQLLIQDANVKEPTDNDRMVINVGHAQAQFLLGVKMPDPDDLRSNPQLLIKLRETLFVLWGDLEERKRQGNNDIRTKHGSNRPFKGCIWEYGTLREGGKQEDITAWSRQFMLHGVTII